MFGFPLYTAGMKLHLSSLFAFAAVSLSFSQVANSSFENPLFGSNSWQYRPSGIPGWTFLNNAGMANGNTAWGTSGQSGVQYAFLQSQGNGGRIRQVVTGFVPGTQYRVTYWAHRRPNNNPGAPIEVLKDGVPISLGVAPATQQWIQHASYWFTATNTTHEIELRTNNEFDRATAIDDVEIASWPPPPYGLPANPGFEFPPLGLNQYAANPGGIQTAWEFLGTSGMANNDSSWGSSAFEGEQYAYIQRSASFNQRIGDFVPGKSYHVQWWMMRRDGGLGADVAQPVRVLYDGAEIAPFQIQTNPVWRNFASKPFTPSSADGVLKFEGGTDVGDRASVIDSVRIFENEVVVPDAISFQRGQQTGGTIASLFQSDNDYLRARQFFVLSLTDPPIQMTVEGTVPPGDPIYLNLEVESAISLTGFNQQLQVLNTQNNSWVTVSETALGNTDTNVDITRLDDASAFVHPVTGKIKCRIWVKRAGPAISSNWTYRIDKVRFYVGMF